MTLAELKESVNTSNGAEYTIRGWGGYRMTSVKWNNIPDYLKNRRVFCACPIRIYCGRVIEWSVTLK